MARLNYPRVFAIAALLILGATAAELVLKVNLKLLLAALAAVCAAGMIGTIAIHGTGPPHPIRRDSSEE